MVRVAVLRDRFVDCTDLGGTSQAGRVTVNEPLRVPSPPGPGDESAETRR